MNKILIDWGIDAKVADRFDETIIAILMIAIAVGVDYLCQAILVGGMRQYTRRKPHLWNTLLMKRKVFHNLIHTIPAILVYALLPMAFMRGKELLVISQKACVIYDVLGDVVCGGFSMPMRRGYADKIFVITSGENMAIHAAANIAMAVENFKDRGYAQLGGLILNRRNVKNEDAKVEELAEDIHSKVIGTLSRSALVTDAEEQKKTVIEAYPDSEMAEEYRILAGKIRTLCEI